MYPPASRFRTISDRGLCMASPFSWKVTTVVVFFAAVELGASAGWGADPKVLRPRVPPDQIAAAKAVSNRLPATPERIEKGKSIFYGKGFCSSCHGLDGKGMAHIPGLRGTLPRNFTDESWQKARTDGELMWILKNGSPGTDMASFIPLVMTEEEAWQVILFVRTFGRK